jgi:hypothetical protein
MTSSSDKFGARQANDVESSPIPDRLSKPTSSSVLTGSSAVDLFLEYMINYGDTLKSSTTDEYQRSEFDGSTNKFWYIKQRDLTRWERYGLYGDTIALERDTTAPPENPNNAYDAAPWGSLAWPRYWSPGNEANFSTTIKHFDKGNCAQGYTNTTPWLDGRHFFRFQGSLDIGGDVGTQDVVIIDRYHAQVHSNPTVVERFWYARGWGWIKFQVFNDPWHNPQFTSTNPTDIQNMQADQEVTFNQKYPEGNGWTADNNVCPNLHP